MVAKFLFGREIYFRERVFRFLVIVSTLTSCASQIPPDFLATLESHNISNNHEAVSRIRYNKAGNRLAVGTWEGNVDLWDTRHKTLIQISAGRSRIDGLYFSNDGRLLITWVVHGSDLRLWDTRTGSLICSIPTGKSGGMVTEIAKTNRFIISSSVGIRLLDATTCNLIGRAGKVAGVVTSLAVDAQGRRVAVGTSSGTIELFKVSSLTGPDGEGGRPFADRIISNKRADWIQAIAFENNGNAIHTLTRSGALDRWKVPNLELDHQIPTGASFVMSASFVEEAELLIFVGSSQSDFISAISLTDGKRVRFPTKTHTSPIDYLPEENALLRIEKNHADLLMLH